MPSKNLFCSWQLILLAAVVLRLGLILADLVAEENPIRPIVAEVMNMKQASTFEAAADDALNGNTISEYDAINVIRLQPPPLTRTLLMPTPIMGTIAIPATATATATTNGLGASSTATATATAPIALSKGPTMSTTKLPTMNAEISMPATVGGKTKTKNHNANDDDDAGDDGDDILNGAYATTAGIETAIRPTGNRHALMETEVAAASVATSKPKSNTFYDDGNNDDVDDGRNGDGEVEPHTTTQISNDDATLLHPPSSDALTKGFTIPTFLPPVREFAVADLPSYLTTSTTTTAPATTMSNELLQQHDQLYLAGYNGHPSARKNLTLQSTNVSVQLGNHAYMPCHIRRLQSKPVSWVRVRDGHILAVDQTTFIADQRFQSIFNEENEHTWSLQIKYVQKSDEGWYECQVSTEPKMSSKMFLEVVVPTTELIGDQSRFVKAGSKVALHCIVRGTIVPPTYIIWFREKNQIVDDEKTGWFTQIDRNIFGNTSENHNTIGSLIIPSVRKKDSGNYTCQPSNSGAVSVDLHVLSGEYSASAIMSAARTHGLNFCYILLIFLLVALQKT